MQKVITIYNNKYKKQKRTKEVPIKNLEAPHI